MLHQIIMHKQQHKYSKPKYPAHQSARQRPAPTPAPATLPSWLPTDPENFTAWANIVDRAIKEHGRAFHAYHFGSKANTDAYTLKQEMDAAYALVSRCLHNAYPRGFWENMDALIAGNAPDLEPYIRFVEADVRFYRSGYARSTVLTALKRHPMTAAEQMRLQNLILSMVDRGWRSEFRYFCRLARYIQTYTFMQELMNRAARGNSEVKARASLVLEACWQQPHLRVQIVHPDAR
jgi:hypothetical protein